MVDNALIMGSSFGKLIVAEFNPETQALHLKYNQYVHNDKIYDILWWDTKKGTFFTSSHDNFVHKMVLNKQRSVHVQTRFKYEE